MELIKKGKKYIATILAIVLCLCAVQLGAVSAFADDKVVSISSGILTLGEVEGGGKFYQFGSTAPVEYTGNIIIVGTTTVNSIFVTNGTHNVIMTGVNITNDSASPFNIRSGATVNMKLVGNNITKTTADSCSSIQVSDGAILNITDDSTGTLTATAGENGAAIGGNEDETTGTININGGTITAESVNGAAIGGGKESAGGTININGGIIKATTSGSGAAIGGGNNGEGGAITINGGNVQAIASNSGAAIGGGNNGTGGNIKIIGGSITATAESGGAIGGGYEGAGGNVTISGGTITARSKLGAGIGGGYKGEGGTVEITGGNVKTTSTNGTSIGAGYGYTGTNNGTLTNGTADVDLTTITLDGLTSTKAISNIAVSEGSYGTNSVTTLDTNRLYIYLPENTYAYSAILEDHSRYIGYVEAGKEGKMTIPISDFIGCSPNFENGSVYMNVYFTLENDVQDDSTAYVKLSCDGVDTNISINDEAISGAVIDVDGIKYYCACFNYAMAPKQMAKDVVATIYYGSGAAVATNTYNLKSASADNEALFSAMKNYGAYAQRYFEYDIKNPIADTVDPAVTIATEDLSVNTAVAGKVEYAGASLVLNDVMKLRVYFNTVGGADGITVNDGETAVIKVADDLYYTDIAVTDAMNSIYSVAVKYNGITQLTVQASPLAVAKNIAEKSNSFDSQNLMKALYNVYLATK